MRFTVFSFLIFLFSHSCFCQISYNIEWENSFGGTNADLAEGDLDITTDGKIFIGGSALSHDGDVSCNNNGQYALTVMSVHPWGQLNVTQCYGGDQSEYMRGLAASSDGGAVVVAVITEFGGQIDTIYGFINIWLIKLSPVDASIEWQQSFGYLPSAVRQVNDGGFAVTGIGAYSDNPVICPEDINAMLTKTDHQGNIEWHSCFGGLGNQDEFYDVQQTSDGGFILSGYACSNNGDTYGNHGGGSDCFVVKTDSFGNKEWSHVYGGSESENAMGIVQTTDGGYIFCASSFSNDDQVSGNHSNGEDYWIVKLDAAGIIQWQKCFGGTGRDQPYSIIRLKNGNVAILGDTDSNDGDVTGNHGLKDLWLVIVDPEGNLLWEKCFGGSGLEHASSVRETTDQDLLFYGDTNSLDGDVQSKTNPGTDYWLVKLDNLNPASVYVLPDENISVTPNPSNGVFIFHSKDILLEEAEVFNVLGEKIFTSSILIPSLSGEIDLSAMESGIYFLHLKAGIGELTKKLVVNK